MHLRRGPRGTRASWSCFGGTGAARQRHWVATDGCGGDPLPCGWLSRNGTPVYQPSHRVGPFLPAHGLCPERCDGRGRQPPSQSPISLCADDQALVKSVTEIMNNQPAGILVE